MNQRPGSKTIPRLLSEQADAYPAAPALICGGRTLTYAELKDAVWEAGRWLIHLGVAPGDKVAVLMGNRIEWVVSALAIAGIGATAVALNTWATPRELEYMLEHSDAKHLILQRRFLKTDYADVFSDLEAIRAKAPLLERVIGVTDDLPNGWLPFLGRIEGAEWPSEPTLRHRMSAVRGDDVAILLYTSGSTARPKGVQLQHYALIENTWNIGERHHVTRRDRLWLAVSLFWGYGCSNALMNMLTHGAAIVLQEHFDAGAALELIEREQCTLIYATPNMAQALYDHPDRKRRDLSSLRGGSASGNREQRIRAIEMAPQICNLYGLSEVYGNSHVTDVDDPLELRLTSCGRPLPGVLQKVVDPDGKRLPPGRIGELCLKGYVTPGYYKDPEQTAKAFDDEGYFRTGDLAYVDEQGFMFFQGRLKEMVKTGGINVSPAEVEAVLLQHPALYLAHVVGLPDTVRGELLAAVVVKKPGTAVTSDEILSFCKSSLAAYKVPRKIRIVAEHELPLTTTKKVQKNKIGETFFSTST
ncbi:class I adenylate-forming enzyme family protein [Parapusillimonas granuli]|uniref:Acyl--CoA ligase n=1 Tax=Parapusillimonas granuli TaxID=380911 RepID=A0A853FXN3_9BURK|nr:class I adenylate-forming enzyme family protein [Parapusillimonas granuli]MBB5214733.1 fatty-acyl-CoA synthase [Parapusillimonas granuli]NYT48859.1 acyl--CoA ligase [Parapusillimonas granuli]